MASPDKPGLAMTSLDSIHHEIISQYSRPSDRLRFDILSGDCAKMVASGILLVRVAGCTLLFLGVCFYSGCANYAYGQNAKRIL